MCFFLIEISFLCLPCSFIKKEKMAKVKFSGLISEMRGKLNGSVFARNRGGAYIRTKVTPSNPKTDAQVQARALLAEFSQAWRGLTQAQRDSWSSVVAQWATTDIFGDVVNPTGSTLFTRLNINIRLAFGAVIVVPPLAVGAFPITTLSVDVDSTSDDFILGTHEADVPVNHGLVIEATPALSAGISNANSRFRVIRVIKENVATNTNVWANYVDKFGTPQAGQKVFVRCKYINNQTGEVSQSLVAQTIVL